MKSLTKPIIAAIFLVAAVLTWQLKEETRNTSASDSDWKKISPFTAVTFEENTILAEYEGVVYQLNSIGGIGSQQLIDAARKEFGTKWQKRIREDIAEVLAAAGAPEGRLVDLELKNLQTGAVKKVSDAEMTEKNRAIIYNPS